MSTTGYIYTLNDPRTDEPKYVGATKQPEDRLQQHIRHQQNEDLADWIAELAEHGLSPDMEIVDSAPLSKLGGLEEEAIDELSDEFELFNRMEKSEYSAPEGILSTTIPIGGDTRDRLRGVKVGNETYSEVIERVLDEAGYD